jgi:signal transduction histidine kinase
MSAGAASPGGGRWRTLRLQLAAVGFVAIYLPVLVLLGVTFLTQDEQIETVDDVAVLDDTTSARPPWVLWTAVALAPAAAATAWWSAGRAVRPIERVRSVAEDIEGSDLGRRIGIERGPTEVVALAASFDAMLDRLQQAADTQRQLIEETSHELRTPLSVLAANADVVLTQPDPDVTAYREGLERSKAAAERMLRTIEDLLAAARGRARTLDREPSDVVAVVRDVVDEARVLAVAKPVDLVVGSPGSVPASVDPVTVRRAVANLVDNAVAHAPPGTQVDVVVEATSADVTIVVTDHGPGIPTDQQAHVFDRFWSGRGDGGGTGLGLPIARQVALAHGGRLTVTSPGPAGDGAQFHLRLRR